MRLTACAMRSCQGMGVEKVCKDDTASVTFVEFVKLLKGVDK